MIRILLADDHNLFREGIISMLKGENELRIVGEAGNGKELIYKFDFLRPDIILSDINMPVKSGPDAVKQILDKNKEAKVLFLSQFTGDDYLYSVIKSGAKGLISKNCMKDDLIFAIKEVCSGRKYFNKKSDKELKKIIKRFENLEMKQMHLHLNLLTPREKEVLMLVGEGLTSDQIAERMNLSKRTIDTHRYRIIHSLGLQSVSELIKFAVLNNLEEKRKNQLYE